MNEADKTNAGESGCPSMWDVWSSKAISIVCGCLALTVLVSSGLHGLALLYTLLWFFIPFLYALLCFAFSDCINKGECVETWPDGDTRMRFEDFRRNISLVDYFKRKSLDGDLVNDALAVIVSITTLMWRLGQAAPSC